jgi:hypothetical protein
MMESEKKDIIYTFEDIENIINNGIDYKLNKNILDQIQLISDKVGAPEYIKTPQFDKREKKKNRDNKRVILNDDWEDIRNFEITERKKNEGIDLTIDSVRKILNKITEKTYDNLYPNLIQSLDELEDKDFNTEDIDKLADSIFVILSQTKFYGKMYSQLFKSLKEKYLFLEKILDIRLNNFKNVIDSIVYINPNIDYDNYCKNNKINEKINSEAIFYVNLLNINDIPIENTIDIINYLINKSLKLLDEDDKTEIIQELGEIYGNMIIQGKENLVKYENWQQIYDKIKLISSYKIKDYKSLSNKFIFKNMDILDVL